MRESEHIQVFFLDNLIVWVYVCVSKKEILLSYCKDDKKKNFLRN